MKKIQKFLSQNNKIINFRANYYNLNKKVWFNQRPFGLNCKKCKNNMIYYNNNNKILH